MQRLRLLAAKYLQHNDGHHVEDRHDDRDQDRDRAELIRAEQCRRHGDAHDDVVAAEHALDHHAAALRQLFREQRVAERQRERQQHAADGVGDQQRVERAGQIGAVYIIKQQARQKDAEGDLVDVRDLLPMDPAEAARAVAERHHEEHRQDRMDRYDEILHLHTTFGEKLKNRRKLAKKRAFHSLLPSLANCKGAGCRAA